MQERAAEEREALSKLRKQKRKSADLETGSAARPVINLTASALASQPDAPRCGPAARARLAHCYNRASHASLSCPQMNEGVPEHPVLAE